MLYRNYISIGVQIDKPHQALKLSKQAPADREGPKNGAQGTQIGPEEGEGEVINEVINGGAATMEAISPRAAPQAPFFPYI